MAIVGRRFVPTRFANVVQLAEALLVEVHVDKACHDATQVRKVGNTIARRSHDQVENDHHPHGMLKLHRDDKEKQQPAFGEEPVARDKNSHQGAGRADNRVVREARHAKHKAEERREHAAEQVHRGKVLCAHVLGDTAAEHPQHEHVEDEVPKVHMHEHVGEVAPGLERARREERTEVDDVVADIAVTGSREVQVQAHHGTQDKRNGEYGRVGD